MLLKFHYFVFKKYVSYSYLHLCPLGVFIFLKDFIVNFSVITKLKPCDQILLLLALNALAECKFWWGILIEDSCCHKDAHFNIYVNEQKRGIFLYVRIPWLSELHLLELLTDQFSVLEAFPIPNLPVEFSQEGATDVR